MTASIEAITYGQGYAATPSDTVADTNGTFAAIQNTGASAACKITMAGMPSTSSVTVYLVQGLIYPLAVQRVWTTGSGGLSTIIGFKALASSIK